MITTVGIISFFIGISSAQFSTRLTVNETCECVPQFQCTYKGTITDDGEGIIDIRSGLVDENPFTARRKCENYLESCCLPPELKPGYNSDPPSPSQVDKIQPPEPNQDRRTQETGVKRPHVSKGCGYRNPNGISFRITGAFNNEANFAEFPWTIAILTNQQVQGKKVRQYACGGSLIHKRVVLTGAHCVAGKEPSELTIRAGEWDTQTVNEPLPHQDRVVATIVVHPGFRKGPLFNNFALLILTKPVKLADNVETICLPEAGDVFDHSRCYATGWGKDKFGKEGNYQVILKAVELPIVSQAQCQSSLRTTALGRYFKLHHSFLCAGGEPGVDTCTGDGGNALVCPLVGEQNRYTQAGIVSWGIKCGINGIPGVYADITKARDWIDETLTNFKISTRTYLKNGDRDVPSDKLDVRIEQGSLKPSGHIVINKKKDVFG